MKSFRLDWSYLVILVLFALVRINAHALTDQTIYGDSLVNGWQNWSWATTDTASTGTVHAGANSIAVTASAWSALALHHDAMDTTGYSSVTFWINGGSVGGQTLRVSALLNDVAQTAVVVGPLQANTWQKVVVSLASLGVDNRAGLTGFWLQEGTGVAQPTFFVDDVALSVSGVPVLTAISVFDDALGSGWQNWSWASVDTASSALVHTGTNSIAVTAGAWAALSLHHDPIDTHGYGNLTFWINGGPIGGQTLKVFGLLSDAAQTGVTVGPLPANTWKKIVIPLTALGVDNRTNLTGIWMQESTGVAQPTFYVDDMTIALPAPPNTMDVAAYDDALINGWQNWSWASVNLAGTATTHTGTNAIAVTAGAYAALFLHHDAIDTHNYTAIEFWINGGSVGGQMLNVAGLLSNQAQAPVVVGPLQANTWVKISLSLASLGVADRFDFNGIWLQESTGVAQPTYYVDDVTLLAPPVPTKVNITINPGKGIRRVDSRLFGLNAAIWDGAFNTTTTQNLLTEIDNRVLRFPGGSISDEYHWVTDTSEGQTFQWATDFDDFATIAKATNAKVFITVNYGSGTPQEAADWVRYSNRTKHYGFKYWEVGNENYGTWEKDLNVRAHDPVTYATRFKEYYQQMKAVDHSIKVGVVIVTGEDSSANYSDESVTNPRTGVTHNGWTPVMLATLKKLGVIPDFVSFHRYAQSPGGENDAILLTSSTTWANDAADLRQQLNDYLGHAAERVELTCTENNSVYTSPGKQSTSLVNGLFLADSLGSLMKTEFNSLVWWDFRNGQGTGDNNSATLYGWRQYGDYGIVNAADPAAPADRYPTFYVYKLLTHFARGGETVVEATSDYPGLGVYAVRKRNGALRILLINKHPSETLNADVTINGHPIGHQATLFSYGIPQDEAARAGIGSADVQSATVTLSGGRTFSFTQAPYAATVLSLDRHDGHDCDRDDDDQDSDNLAGTTD